MNVAWQISMFSFPLSRKFQDSGLAFERLDLICVWLASHDTWLRVHKQTNDMASLACLDLTLWTRKCPICWFVRRVLFSVVCAKITSYHFYDVQYRGHLMKQVWWRENQGWFSSWSSQDNLAHQLLIKLSGTIKKCCDFECFSSASRCWLQSGHYVNIQYAWARLVDFWIA